MGKKIACMGAGAVGSYVGGHLSRAGHDVTLIDPWPEHIETIRRNGLSLSGMTDEETCTVRLPTMHVSEVQSLIRQRPIDIAIVSTKSYDTEWAATLIRPYLASEGFVGVEGVVVAGGTTSRGDFAQRAAAALAERLGTPLVDFPGDHGGFATEAEDFVAVLRRTLA